MNELWSAFPRDPRVKRLLNKQSIQEPREAAGTSLGVVRVNATWAIGTPSLLSTSRQLPKLETELESSSTQWPCLHSAHLPFSVHSAGSSQAPAIPRIGCWGLFAPLGVAWFLLYCPESP
jgi:hypothetical protein